MLQLANRKLKLRKPECLRISYEFYNDIKIHINRLFPKISNSLIYSLCKYLFPNNRNSLMHKNNLSIEPFFGDSSFGICVGPVDAARGRGRFQPAQIGRGGE